MRVFVSQPMDGKTEKEINLERIEAETWLQNYLGNRVEIVSAYTQEEAPVNLTHGRIGLWYMAHSIKVMSECDAILLLGNWWSSRGCQVEAKIAQEYELPILVKEMPRL